MLPFFRYCFFFIFLFFLPGIIFGQKKHPQTLRIVKDNITCLYGLKNDSGKWVTPAQYTTLKPESEQYFIASHYFIASSGNKYGVLDQWGKLIIPVNNESVTPFNGRTFSFILCKDKKYGVADKNGKVFIPLAFDTISPCAYYYYRVRANNQYGLFTIYGRPVLALEYQTIREAGCLYGYVFSKNNSDFGYGDTTGIRIQAAYANLQSFCQGTFLIVTSKTNPGKKGMMTFDGDTLLPLIYDDIFYREDYYDHIAINEKRLTVKINNKLGVVDVYGHTIIPVGIELLPIYDYLHNPTDEMRLIYRNDTLPARRNLKWGLLTGNGNWATEQIYDSILPHYCNSEDCYYSTYIIIKNGKYGTMNRDGKISIPAIYDSLKQFNGEYRSDINMPFIIVKNGKYGTISKDGKVSSAAIYDSIIPTVDENDLEIDMPFIVTQNGKYGALNKDGLKLLPTIYDSLVFCVDYTRDYGLYGGLGSFSYASYYIVKTDGHYGIESFYSYSGFHFWIPTTISSLAESGNSPDLTTPATPDIYNKIITDDDAKFFFTNEKDVLVINRGSGSSDFQHADIRSPVSTPTALTYYFNISDSLVLYKLKRDKSGNIENEYYFNDKNTQDQSVYENDFYVFYKPNSRGEKNLVPAYGVQVFEDTMVGYTIGVITLSDDTLYFNKNGKRIVNPLRGKEIVNRFNGNYIFRGQENKLGMFNKDGKIIMQPIYYGLQPMKFDHHSYLWIKFQADTSCPFHHFNKWDKNDCPCGWTLCDSLAHPISKVIFDYPFIFRTNLQPVFVNGKAGLFDLISRQFAIPPHYHEIIPVYPSYYSILGENETYQPTNAHPAENVFFVKRNNSEFGIMDKNGKWVSDSTFTELYFFPRRNHVLCKGGNTNLFSDQRKLITGNSHSLMIDENGVMTTDSLLMDSLIFQSFVMGDFNGQGSYYHDQDEYGPFKVKSAQNNPGSIYSHPYYQEQYYYGYPNQYPQIHYGPDFMKSGPTIDFRSSLQHNEKYSFTDSIFISAMQFSLDYLLSKYKCAFVRYPVLRNLECECTTTILNPTFHQEINFPDQNRASQQCDNFNNVDFLNRGEITFLAPKEFSLLFHFNPDSSKAAQNNLAPYFLNFRKTKNGYVPITLDSIFCPNVNYAIVLNKLIIKAISKRDDLNLDCNNPQSYFALSHGRFSFSKEGLQFYIDYSKNGGIFNVVIPWNEIQPYSRVGGIVDDFIESRSGEHCRPASDTTAIDFKFQNYVHVNDFANSDFLKREKFQSCSYFFSDSGQINGMRFCCAGNVVYAIYFEETKVENAKQFLDNHDKTGLDSIPKQIKKSKITKMIRIENFPCG